MCNVCALSRPYETDCLYQQLQSGEAPGYGLVFYELVDAPDNVHFRNDTGVMTVNSTYNGIVSEAGDSDWIRIDFVQGKTYNIQMYSLSMETFLGLTDNNGNLLTFDDYSLVNYLGWNYAVSELTVTASRTGTYYLIAEELGSNAAGGYTVGVTEVVVPPGTQTDWTLDQIAHRLTDSGWAFFGGTRRAWDKDTITYNDSGLDPGARALVEHAFAAWEKVTGLTFVRTTGTADITMDDNDPDKAYANSQLKTTGAIQSANINVSPGFGGSTNHIDSYLFQTYVHEIGHAIGLAHAGDYNAGSGGPTTYPDSVLYLNDSWNTTIMSYINQNMNTNDKADYALIMTPMIADIIAVQDLYGVPLKAYEGNTRYGVNSNTGDYMDLVFDALCEKDFSSALINGGRTMSFTLWDTAGRDIIDFRTDTFRQRIDLREEKLSDIYGVKGAMVVGRDTVIEDYVGGTKGDRVFGNGAGNVLDGFKGNDVLKGLFGKDTLKGGAGRDKLFGGAGNDVLNGMKGNDNLKGEKGADNFIFKRGYDKDTVVDFKNNIDTLKIDNNLWTGKLSKQQVIDRFGSMQAGDAVFDFGGGDVLTVNDITLSQLKDDIVFI